MSPPPRFAASNPPQRGAMDPPRGANPPLRGGNLIPFARQICGGPGQPPPGILTSPGLLVGGAEAFEGGVHSLSGRP